ncbi:mobile mystery protein A [soil metagenome]
MSSKIPNPLMRYALEHQLAQLRKLDVIRPGRGWIKAIRESLGMTTGQLARRLGVTQPRIAVLEKAEENEVVTLKSLRQAAEALNCTLVYALVPNQPLETLIKERARSVADKQLSLTNHTMRLEDQAMSGSRFLRARDDLAEELARNDRRLWDDQ